jgi:hypothetical protein
LFLTDTNITDEGLKQLKRFFQLEILGLRAARVTDGGLVHLKELAKLKTLDLIDTKVTDAGINNLKMALPELEVWKSR